MNNNTNPFIFDITPGDVHINSAGVYSQSDVHCLLVAELQQKHAEVYYRSGREVAVIRSDTVDQATEVGPCPTTITFTEVPEGWQVIYSWVSRYSLFVLLGSGHEDRQSFYVAPQDP